MSWIDVSSTAVGNVLQLYAYEPFNNVYKTTNERGLLFSTSSPELLGFLRNLDVSTVAFSSSNGFNIGFANPLSLVLQDASFANTYSNVVNIGPGRIVTPNGTVYTFYRNEPVVPQPFQTAIPIQTPFSSPTLPPGLSFVRTDVSGYTYELSGKPLVQIPTSNYTIIGRGSVDPTKIVTTRVNIAVAGERVLMDLSGSSNVTLISGTPIVTRAITSRAPPYPLVGNNIRYTWSPALPDGLVVKDIGNVTRASGFVASDASSTLVLTGSPTDAAVRNATSKVVSTTFVATRVSTPNISNSAAFTFTFNEQVVFDTLNVSSQFYVGADVSSSKTSNSFFAYTRFPNVVDASITTIFSPNLRDDLSLSFVFNDQRAYLYGKPLSTGSGTFTVVASNGNGVANSNPVNFSIVNDTITFVSPTPSVDTCLNFIVSRSPLASKAGYYTAPIQFKASAASGCNFTVRTNDLSGTGLTLSNVGSNTYQISGLPLVTKALSVLQVDASSTVTAASNSTTLNFAILADTFSFRDASFAFIQNRKLPQPYQFDASTNSERPIVGYSSPNLPNGLSLSPTGLLSGAILSGSDTSFNIVASTGYASGTKQYLCSVTPDAMLLLTNPLSYAYPPSSPVNIQITGLTYSGKSVSNYAFSNFTQSYGLSIQSSTGKISGTLTDSLPPNPLLPTVSNFGVTAQAGTFLGTLPAVLTTSNPIVNRGFVFADSNGFVKSYTYENPNSNLPPLINDFTIVPEVTTLITDVKFKNTSIDSNVFLAAVPKDNAIVRSTNGVSFTKVVVDTTRNPIPYQLVYASNTSTWYTLGMMDRAPGFADPFVIRSTNDGLTWDVSGAASLSPFAPRVSSPTSNYYTDKGLALAHKNGVFLAGGGTFGGSKTMKRSTDGSNWNDIVTSFGTEVAYINTDDTNTWVATGSDQNATGVLGTPASYNTQTILYSTDQGITWNGAVGGFAINGYNIAYGSNTWLACGKDFDGNGFLPSLKYSTNGTQWSNADLSANPLFVYDTNPDNVRIGTSNWGIGPLRFDGSNWEVIVHKGGISPQTSLFRHAGSTPLNDGNWTEVSISVDPQYPITVFSPNQYIRTGTPTLATFTFNSLPTNNIVFSSPTQTSYVFYQYMPIAPISFNATGVGRVYYLIDSNDLPIGIQFDPITKVISGTPMYLGQNNITVYAKDDTGVATLTLYTNTILPRIIRNQTSAGAYTSMLRQYTQVNAAQNARDNKVYPASTTSLGEFQSPPAPDVITQTICLK